MPLDFDPWSDTQCTDPFPVYRALRDHEGIFQSATRGAYCVSRYDDVSYVLTHPNLFSSEDMFEAISAGRWNDLGWRDVVEVVRYSWQLRANPLRLRSARSLLTSDPPKHAVLRNIVNRGFTPRRIASWEDRIRELARECIAPLRRGLPLKLVDELAIPLPVAVISEMLGVETERQGDFKKWSDALMAGSTGSESIGVFIRGMRDLHVYLDKIVAERKRNPAEDLISVLVDPKHEDSLDAEGLILFIVLLLVAGNETTTNLIGNAVTNLLRHPDQLERVKADLSLVPGLIEETIRYEGPVQSIFRHAKEAVELAGTVIPKGATVCVLLGSANRDERKFEEPDRFDVERNPRGHVGFGMGIHFCLGAALARLEARVTLEELIPLLRLDESTDLYPPMVDSFLVRGPARLTLPPLPPEDSLRA